MKVNLQNDIALLKLKDDIKLSETTKTISISNEHIEVSNKALVSGWEDSNVCIIIIKKKKNNSLD